LAWTVYLRVLALDRDVQVKQKKIQSETRGSNSPSFICEYKPRNLN